MKNNQILVAYIVILTTQLSVVKLTLRVGISHSIAHAFGYIAIGNLTTC